MRHRWIAVLACAALLPLGTARAQVQIGPDLGAIPPGGEVYGDYIEFGKYDDTSRRAVAGQTFTVPDVANVLTRFSFMVSPRYGDPVFRLYVMRWDGAAFRPTGSVRYRSGPRTVESDAQQIYEFSTGNLWLRPGAMYVAFLGTFDDPQPAGEAIHGLDVLYFTDADGGSTETSPYAGGSAVGSGTTGGLSALRSGRWQQIDGGATDTEFSATFAGSAVPEPASMALLGTGLAGLVGAVRRRRRREEA